MRLTEVKEMQKLDQMLGESVIPVIIPMEHAGKAVADVALKILRGKKRVVLVCGKGNNGGDGFGAARWLAAYGFKVQCFGIGISRNEAMTEYKLLSDSGVEVVTLRSVQDLDYCLVSIAKADLVIDALLGTGLKGGLGEEYVQLCDVINKAVCPVLSIDVPSGINAETGEADQHAVVADVTVTLVRPKVGMLLYPARKYVGRLYVAQIGFPPQLLIKDNSKVYLADRAMMRDLLPLRQADAHKGDNGRVTVVAGSPGFTGAAALCTRGAVKAGAGLVSLLTPAAAYQVLAMKLDEEMVKPLPEVLPGILGTEAYIKILDARGDVLAMGPGLGTSAETSDQVRKVVQNSTVPMVLDADALTALAGHLDILVNANAPIVLTPHSGEFARLAGLDVEDVNRSRLELVRHYAQKWKVVLLLKGAPTIVAVPEGAVYLMDSGCSAMATGGSGDVLTGVIAALLAQGLDAEMAAICGAYLHGLAGSMATGGAPGLAAGEIAQNLPNAWQKVYEEEEGENFSNGGISPVE